MTHPVLFWHRRDLRLSDNGGLTAALARGPVVGVFCLDPALLRPGVVAPARVAYMLGCVRALQTHYTALGGALVVLQGDPTQAVVALAQALQAPAVYWNPDVEPYARQRDEAVTAALGTVGVDAQPQGWDQLLHGPGEVLTGSRTPYTVYTPYWKNWITQPKAPPYPTPSGFPPLSEAQNATVAAASCPLPTAAELGFAWDGPFPVEPGEGAALDQLAVFCDSDQAIGTYDDQRNLPAVAGTSNLSAALKFGAVGIRTVWAAATEAYDRCRSDEARQNVRTWQQELAWREFYQTVMYTFPALAEGPYRPLWQDFPWDNSEAHFQAWCAGRTGYPIVDAAMRQLTESGWMHNRCRMIVASFLTKDLIVDWRRGEAFFMQHLVDGDLSANNGGWQWSASSGMDPKPLRIFNPASQAQKFDPEAEYIRTWLPELRSVDPEHLVKGTLSAAEAKAVGYPLPIVNHKTQQARFKQKYAELKARYR